ncbi:MAG TPA: recombinase family protein [Bryobacteraceae bacterium]|jgi:DNA invertase Pin-like site-specific DNA recombinase|nr:recombinase family protein [Bryobacteraceae bacterium]
MRIGYPRVSTDDQTLDLIVWRLGASLTEQIGTRSTTGQLVFHVFGALAEFERYLIRERTLAGLKASRARGSNDGRRAVRRCPFYALSKCLHLTRPPRETQ